MFRKVCLVLILIQICIKTIESKWKDSVECENLFSFFKRSLGVQIEYPIKNKYIEERIRSDLNLIDPLLRYYVVQREIQFQSEAVRKDLPFFLRCKGSKKSLNFTVPSTAIQVRTLLTCSLASLFFKIHFFFSAFDVNYGYTEKHNNCRIATKEIDKWFSWTLYLFRND